MKVTAAVFNAVGQDITIEQIDLDEPRDGEVLVRMAASGVCHSDYHVVKGEWGVTAPVVLGHEGAGIVEAVGPGVTTLEVGDHVVLSWVPNCGHCKYCRLGRPALCLQLHRTAYAGVMNDGTSRLSRNGETVYSYGAVASFADRAVVPESGAIKVRKDAPLDKVALIGCAVATGIGAVINTTNVRPGDSVLVIGCGGVGLSVVMGAALVSAAEIIAVDINDDSLLRAKNLGATATINSSRADLAAVVREIAGPDGVDWAFEAIGLKHTIESAYDLIRPGGTAVVVGQSAGGVKVEIDPLIMSDREKSLIGSNYGTCDPAVDFPRMVDLYMKGELDLDQLIARTGSIHDVNDAFAALGRGEAGRTVITY